MVKFNIKKLLRNRLSFHATLLKLQYKRWTYNNISKGMVNSAQETVKIDNVILVPAFSAGVCNEDRKPTYFEAKREMRRTNKSIMLFNKFYDDYKDLWKRIIMTELLKHKSCSAKQLRNRLKNVPDLLVFRSIAELKAEHWIDKKYGVYFITNEAKYVKAVLDGQIM